MKKFLLVLLFSTVSLSIKAQEISRQKEIGLLFSGLDRFGIGYKIGTEKSMWRFNTLLLSGKNSKNENEISINDIENFGFSSQFGKEYRKGIVKNFELRFGADLQFGYEHAKQDIENKISPNNNYYIKTNIYSIGINGVFGFNYVINEALVIGAELLPSISYQTGKNYTQFGDDPERIEGDISSLNYGISNTSAVLSISFRFH